MQRGRFEGEGERGESGGDVRGEDSMWGWLQVKEADVRDGRRRIGSVFAGEPGSYTSMSPLNKGSSGSFSKAVSDFNASSQLQLILDRVT